MHTCKPYMVIVLALICAGTASAGDVLIGDRSGLLLTGSAHAGYIARAAAPSDDVSVVAPWPIDINDAVVAEDGALYVAEGPPGGGIGRYDLATGATDGWWLPLQDAWDIAGDAQGNLMVLDRYVPATAFSGVFRVALSGAADLVDSIPDFAMMGMDVPHAGPYEDGVIVLAFHLYPAGDGSFFLWRYARQADGSLRREGPFGPLDLRSFYTTAPCLGYAFKFTATHLAVRPSGLSVLVPEECRRVVQEFDLDGNLIRTFAQVEPDPTILHPSSRDPTRVYDDAPTNVHVTPDDHVWVTTRRRVYHYDPAGSLVRRLDFLFNQASAVTDAEYVPFASAGANCEPKPIGYWRRQCLGEDQGGPMLRATAAGRALPPGPGVHPTFGDGRLPSLLTRVDARLSRYGVPACEALWPERPNEWRGKALARYAAAVFNFEDKRLARHCSTTVDHAPTTAGAVLLRVAELLDENTDDSNRQAARLANVLLTGRTGE